MIILPAIVDVKPTVETFPLAFRDVYQEIEADAREMGEAEFSDAEWDAMADEAALRDLADEGRFWM